MRPTERPSLFGRDVERVHCVGIGGMGVGPLALYLAQLGFVVTGEDDALSEDMRALLRRDGVSVGEMPERCDLIVCSSAIPRTHRAHQSAVARQIPLVRRGDLLAELARDRKLVAVCGSHGKTTTTALLITALRQAQFPAGYILGGLFADGSSPARVGSSDWLVAEIDESDGTIDRFAPELTVLVNVDWDHCDRYRTAKDIETTFAALVQRTRGTTLITDACAGSARVTAGRANVLTCGRTGDFQAEWTARTPESLALRLGGRFAISEATVPAQGDFNAVNATLALAAAQRVGASLSPLALREFPGVRRRQSVLHRGDGVTVIEDYAHHPAEIRALLGGLRGRNSRGRLVAVFQPHRFTRTAQFKVEFAAALGSADVVHLLDVYSAGEAPVAGGTTADIYAELKRSGAALDVSYFPADDAEFFRALTRQTRAGDVIVFVGAGDIDRKARKWLEHWHAAASVGARWDEHLQALKVRLSASARLSREEPLANKTTMRVGGAARLYAEPATVADVQALVTGAKERGLDVFVLGRGSNLIVPDAGVDGLVIAFTEASWGQFEPRDDGRVWVGAGLRLKNLCGKAATSGLRGFEFLEGIPGNIGGALRMNAGAMGGWMFDVVEAVQVVTLEGEVRTLAKADLHIDYRHCAELQNAIAVGALLRPAAQAEAQAITRQIDDYRRKRKESQPRESSAGCIFKNPPGTSAGRLIDECGLKGERVGDAEVSAVHANFIINRGGATSADILELVRRIRARVREVKGVDLEPEALLYGRRWEDVL